ncbi:GFA family protein [Shewanella sp. C32]|uniref:GFA family protein n=1 Tax=Shewanella electrica TaxID=515560 RepID=A0ABT2FJ22_9GAMM|nr:GFA family protein [Shewanella electrica]MCH1923564.1 GFA family protein [Shewanella electrica]MCS4555660.1 GFA family protein [Shewanella electrica]
MSATYRGTCLCGSVTFELCGEFQSFYLCHCHRCQKDTGSAHAANLFASGQLTWLSGERDVKTYQHANSRHVKSFCQHCGSAVPTAAVVNDWVMVPAGSLDSAVDIAPTAKIFMASAADWSRCLADVASYAGFSDTATS